LSTASTETVTTVTLTPRVRSALLRYRVIAYLESVLLILLTIAVVIQVAAHNKSMEVVIGTAHGWIYVVFLLLTLDLAVKARFRPGTAILVLLSGTVPVFSLVAERYVTKRVRSGAKI
jgi:integral membrane protein